MTDEIFGYYGSWPSHLRVHVEANGRLSLRHREALGRRYDTIDPKDFAGMRRYVSNYVAIAAFDLLHFNSRQTSHIFSDLA